MPVLVQKNREDQDKSGPEVVDISRLYRSPYFVRESIYLKTQKPESDWIVVKG